MAFWITTHDPQRLDRWDHIFGLDRLPVKTAVPRIQHTQAGEILAYDLDSSRLSDGQIGRYAAVLSRRYAMSYAEALYVIKSGQVTIPATGTEQVTAEEVRPSLSIWQQIKNLLGVSYSELNGGGGLSYSH